MQIDIAHMTFTDVQLARRLKSKRESKAFQFD